MQTETIKKIIYRFQDSSVPPRYHRSYTITVEESNVSIIVDSYGDILASKNYSIQKEQFEKVVTAIHDCQIVNLNLKENEGCTGGTTEKISYYSKSGTELFSGWVYYCGREDSGNLHGDIKTFSYVVKKLIPDLSDLIAH